MASLPDAVLVDALFAQAPYGVALYDAHGHLAGANRAYERHWGIRVADVPPAYSVLTDPQFRESGLLEPIRRVYAGEVVTLPPLRYDAARATGGTGQAVWTQGHCYPIRGGDGEVAYLAAVHIDVTDRMRAEAALRVANEELASRAALLQAQTTELAVGAADLARTRDAAEEARAAAEALRGRAEASEAMARQLFTMSPLPTWVYDAETLAFLDVNEAAVQRYGYAREEFLAMTIRDIRPPEDVARMLSVARAPHPTGASQGVFRHRTRAGELLEVEVFLRDVQYAGRRGVLAVVQDVTTRRRTEAALLEATRAAEAARDEADLERRRLLTVLEQLPVGVHVAEAPSGRLVLDNAALRAIYGEARRSERVADYSADYVGHYPDGHPRAGAPLASDAWPLARALASGAPVPAELVEVRRADGTRLLASVSATPVRDADGRVVGGVATSVDVTERERLLAESERARTDAERARRETDGILRATGDGILGVDLDGRTTFANPAAERLLGWPAAELVGQLQHALMHHSRVDGSAYPAAECALHRAVRSGTAARVDDEVFWRRDGTSFPVEYAITPLVEHDAVVGAVVTFRDVTARRAADAERQRLLEAERVARAAAEAAQAEAEAANRAKSEFLAVMSHELRTPLNAIGGYAELIEMGVRGPVTPQQREDLRRVQASQRHLLGLINEVLNYAKLETGAVHFELTAVRVRDALAGAEALVAPQARAKGLTLALAECPPALAAQADAEKLRQILVNLLSNAVKFTDRGGRIALACADAGTHVAVTVTDTGMGIPADQQERIFDPFVQVRAELTRTAEGTGLGLAISRDLARGMGGDLTVRSEPGAGSTFTLVLPRA